MPDRVKCYVVESTFDTIKKKYQDVRQNILARIIEVENPLPDKTSTVKPYQANGQTSNHENQSTSNVPSPQVNGNTNNNNQNENNSNENANQRSNSLSAESGTPNNIEQNAHSANSLGTTAATSTQTATNLQGENDSFANPSTVIDLNTTSAVDLLQIQYDDIMDIIANARDINESSSSGTIRVHMELLNGMWNEIRKLVYDYKSAGKQLGFNYNVLMSKYMDVTSKLTDFLQPNTSSRSESMHTNSQFSLPKIELSKFSGKSNEWKGFIALFDRMIHNNVKIDRGINIEYLKSCVKDSAAKIINHHA